MGRTSVERRLHGVLVGKPRTKSREQAGTGASEGREGWTVMEGSCPPGVQLLQATAVEGLVFRFIAASGKELSTTLPSLENHSE